MGDLQAWVNLCNTELSLVAGACQRYELLPARAGTDLWPPHCCALSCEDRGAGRGCFAIPGGGARLVGRTSLRGVYVAMTRVDDRRHPTAPGGGPDTPASAECSPPHSRVRDAPRSSRC